jgi:hypothetical protein
MPQREWRRLFITGASPEEAAQAVERHRHNTRAADRRRKR